MSLHQQAGTLRGWVWGQRPGSVATLGMKGPWRKSPWGSCWFVSPSPALLFPPLGSGSFHHVSPPSPVPAAGHFPRGWWLYHLSLFSARLSGPCLSLGLPLPLLQASSLHLMPQPPGLGALSLAPLGCLWVRYEVCGGLLFVGSVCIFWSSSDPPRLQHLTLLMTLFFFFSFFHLFRATSKRVATELPATALGSVQPRVHFFPHRILVTTSQ